MDNNVLNGFKRPGADGDNEVFIGGTISLLNNSNFLVENSSPSINDDDEFIIIRDNKPFAVTAETLAAYIVAENTTFTDIDSTDSPYTMLSTDENILADATNGAITVIPLPAATGPKKRLTVKKIDAVANDVTISPAGNIDNAATKVISAQNVSYGFATDGTQYWLLG